VRLGFEIEPQTEGYIRYCVASGIYQTQAENKVRPALSTRLRSELKYILQADYWKPALQLLGTLGALQCIHPTLELDKQLWRQLRLLECCLRRLKSEYSVTDWLLRLELIIAHLDPEYRGKVADNLQLPDDSIKRLLNLAQSQTEIIASLPLYQLPSQVVKQLRRYDLPTLFCLLCKVRAQFATKFGNISPTGLTFSRH
jgi:tRNA nucleotidyltransferase (CCA-adding enzyme)